MAVALVVTQPAPDGTNVSDDVDQIYYRARFACGQTRLTPKRSDATSGAIRTSRAANAGKSSSATAAAEAPADVGVAFHIIADVGR
ncbi:unnamed protein product [Heligmosomoides polygyrus]|uniref:Transposase n=1 Tax=Heligmosomoides polygyrus TaxID=6339 RepID=A0A183GK86_HELPZ|nr:unnamed protein product [Heligmosomoides polygyrus]